MTGIDVMVGRFRYLLWMPGRSDGVIYWHVLAVITDMFTNSASYTRVCACVHVCVCGLSQTESVPYHPYPA